THRGAPVERVMKLFRPKLSKLYLIAFAIVIVLTSILPSNDGELVEYWPSFTPLINISFQTLASLATLFSSLWLYLALKHGTQVYSFSTLCLLWLASILVPVVMAACVLFGTGGKGPFLVYAYLDIIFLVTFAVMTYRALARRERLAEAGVPSKRGL